MFNRSPTFSCGPILRLSLFKKQTFVELIEIFLDELKKAFEQKKIVEGGFCFRLFQDTDVRRERTQVSQKMSP
jgi:hypothetical protein